MDFKPCGASSDTGGKTEIEQSVGRQNLASHVRNNRFESINGISATRLNDLTLLGFTHDR